jgi:hypothetical protein
MLQQQQEHGDETKSLLDEDLDFEVEDGQMDEDIQEDEEVPEDGDGVPGNDVPEAVGVQAPQGQKRQMRAFGVDGPPRKRLDERWTQDEVDRWASTIEDLLPPRPREDSTKAIIVGTKDTSLGIRVALRNAGLELVAGTVSPVSPGNYSVSGLDRQSWAILDLVVGELHPLKREVPVKVVTPTAWLEYEDLSVYIVPSQRLVPEDVATGYPSVGFKRPIRIYRVYDPSGRRKEVRAVFDSLDSRSAVLQGRETFRIHGTKASLYKTITQPPKARANNRAAPPPNRRGPPPPRNPPPGNRARRGQHE